MSVQVRAQEKDLRTKKLAVRPVPNVGEKVFAVIPPFKITSLMPDECQSVMQKPTQFFTARTIWRPSEEQKYIEVFKKLVAEKKVFCVGKIGKNLQVELSDEGHAHLMEMDKKYTW